MTFGFDAIGMHAIGEMISEFAPPLYFEPVSRIQSGGGIAKPAQLADLSVGILWDTEDEIIWDDDSGIGWEA